jgi:dienelactone hydrolase
MQPIRVLSLLFLISLLAACRPGLGAAAASPAAPASSAASVAEPTVTPAPLALPTPTPEPASEPAPTTELAPAPTAAPAAPEPAFPVGAELTIAALLEREIEGSAVTIEQQLENGANYARYIASYISEGNKIYGLLTIPFGDAPAGGHKAIVFIHGYIPPDIYRTTERYVAYVDALARAGFVVFKIDLRGFGDSEGEPAGAYFSPAYSIDAIAALKSLQTLDSVDPEGIGLWGHSMAGNVTLRAMLVEPAVQAGVIWAGAVYSYDDFTRYAIDDPSYNPATAAATASQRAGRLIRETYGPPDTAVPYWQAVSLTEHLDLLGAPLQLHHAIDDDVVNIGYSADLAAALEAAGKVHEFYQYEGGGHNINSPYFDAAMERTIAFFREQL